MQTEPIMFYRFVMTPDEFRLISKALRGMLELAEIPLAVVLQEKMMRDRAAQAANFAREAQKAVGNIEKGRS